MKKLILTVLLASASMASAATVSLGGLPAPRPGVVDNNSVLLTTGEFSMTVGGFSGNVAPAISDQPSFKAALEAFTQFGTAPSTSDRVAGTFVGVAPSSLDGAKVFVVVHSGATLAATLLDPAGIAVILETQSLFPNPVAGAGSVAITSNINNFTLVGNQGSRIDNPTGVDVVGLAPVNPIPEPSGALLAFGSVMLLLRRRRA
jgi:hypothetical protein